MSKKSRGRRELAPLRSLQARPGAGLALILPGLAEVYRLYLESAQTLLTIGDAFNAEGWTCAQLGGLAVGAPHEQGHVHALEDLVAFMIDAGTPAALAYLRVMAIVGPYALRDDAARGAMILAAKGVPDPVWAPMLGRIEPGSAWLVDERSSRSVLAEFTYTDGSARHGLSVELAETNIGPVPVSILMIGDVDGLIHAIRGDGGYVEPLSAMEAGKLMQTALVNAGEVPKTSVDPTFYTNLPLAVHRVEALLQSSTA